LAPPSDRPYRPAGRRRRTWTHSSTNGGRPKYSRCCSSSYPKWPTLQLSLVIASSGCAGTKPSTCVDCLHSGSTGGQLPGSDRCRIFGSTGCEPPAFTGCSAVPPDLWRPSDLRRMILLRQGRRPTSDSHRMSSFGSAGCAVPAFTGCCPCLPGWLRLRLASAVSPSGFCRP